MLVFVRNTDSIKISIIDYHQNTNENELFFIMKMNCSNDNENATETKSFSEEIEGIILGF